MLLTMTVILAIANAETQPEYRYPLIHQHGKVVPLPDAAQQPQPDSKICVDLTHGAPPEKLNPAVEKLARFVNIYAGAGREPAKLRLVVVIHGKATATVLKDAAYARRFKTKSNPNLPLVRKLKKAGVRFYVCGQALAGKGYPQNEVAGEFTTAVSALTANVNYQRRGFAFIPLH